MTIHLRDDDSTKVSAILERLTLCFSGLTYTRVEHEHRHVGLDSFADLHHFLEKLAFLLVSTTRIYDDDFESLLLEFRDTLRRDGDRIGFGVGPKVCDFGFRRGLTRLVECTGTEGVSTDNT